MRRTFALIERNGFAKRDLFEAEELEELKDYLEEKTGAAFDVGVEWEDVEI